MTLPQNTTTLLFREEQPVRQLWIWLILLAIAGVQWYGAITQLMLGRPFGNNPAPNWVLALFWLVFGVGFPVAAYFTRLITEVRPDGVHYKYVPFHLAYRHIPFAHISQYQAVSYRPLWEYGGWGIRFNRRSRAYTMSGNRGVQFELTNGKRILIGSRRAEEMAQAIAAAQ